MKHPQCASVVAMVRPAAFGYNEETALNNFFQQNTGGDDLQQLALRQFDKMVALLRSKGIEVLVLNDDKETIKPDAIFPNNWFSCNNGQITIFPMEAVNRRREKRQELIDEIKRKTGIEDLHDLSNHEVEEIYLEGTGSIVFDHPNKIAYACYSTRTNPELLEAYCRSIQYLPIGFTAGDELGRPIYHTNVMMCVGERFAIICMEAVLDDIDKKKIHHELTSTGHELINISFQQMNHFAGNMLELRNNAGEHFLVMSSSAREVLDQTQINIIQKHAEILTVDVSVIESTAGGSARCMIAELFY